jgi:uncharacterized protein
MIASRYVVEADAPDGKTRIYYNIRNGVGLKLDAERFPNLAAARNHPSLEEFLLNNKFLVDDPNEEPQAVLREYMEKRDSMPLHLILLVHQNCNFRCVYCYEKFEKNKMTADVEEGIKRFVTRRLQERDYPVLSVSWFGGEPLLATDVMHRLAVHFQGEAAAHDIPYVASITTNGYFLDDVTVSQLLRDNVKSFQVTLDGTKECHDRQRILKGGQPTYDRIVNNLRRMKARSEKFRVMIRMNVGPENVRYVDEHIDRMREWFGDDERFLLYFHNIGRWGGPNDDTLDVCSENMAVKLIARSLERDMAAMPAATYIQPHQTCYAASPHSFAIGVDGMVYKCTVALYDERNQVGQLRADGTMTVYEERLRLWTDSGLTDSGCRQCFFAPSCHGDICPLARIQSGRRPCPDWKHHLPELLQVMDRQGYGFARTRGGAG